jgi:hypothetical protein
MAYTEQEFSTMIKTKYPQYSTMNDADLVKAVVNKYPQYKTQVQATEPTETSIIDRGINAFASVPKIAKAGVEKVGSGVSDITGAFGKEGILGEAKVAEQGIDRSMQNRAAQFFRGISRIGAGALTTGFGATPVGAGLSAGTGALEPEIQQGIESFTSTDIGKQSIDAWNTLSDAQKEGVVNILESAPFIPKASATALASGVKQTAQATKAVAGLPVKAVAGTGKAIGELGVKATGLNKETLKTIVQNPEKYEQAKQIGTDIRRESVASNVLDKISERQGQLSATGKEYESIRSIKDVVSPDDVLKQVDDALAKEKIIRTDSGLDFSGTPLGQTDQLAINNAMKEVADVIGEKTILNGDDIMNLRRRIDKTIGWDSGVTSDGKSAVKSIRAYVDRLAGEKIPQLKELDARFSKEISELKEISKDYFDRKGNLKDNALSKISNLTRQGNEAKLARVKSLFKDSGVDIEKDLKIIKALEDIDSTHKVGTYFQSIMTGGLAAGLTSNPFGALLGVLGIPGVAPFLAKTIGKSANWVDKVKSKITKEFIDANKSSIDGVKSKFNTQSLPVDQSTAIKEIKPNASMTNKTGVDINKNVISPTLPQTPKKVNKITGTRGAIGKDVNQPPQSFNQAGTAGVPKELQKNFSLDPVADKESTIILVDANKLQKFADKTVMDFGAKDQITRTSDEFGNKLTRAKDFIKNNNDIQVPDMIFTGNGEVYRMEGAHRFRAMKELSKGKAVVSVPTKNLEIVKNQDWFISTVK